MRVSAADAATWDAAAIEVHLRTSDPATVAAILDAADECRAATVGPAVHLRGLVEITNHCRRSCLYCGIRAANRAVTRYRMSTEEVVDCAREAARRGYGTVVLQGGEDPGLTTTAVVDLVQRVRAATGLAVTLSLGERPASDLAAFRAAGADRYLLRFETSDRALFDRIHPSQSGSLGDRVAQLRVLRELGYEVGSGVMVGLPGQSYASLAADIALFRALDLDMVGVGPYVPHPDTPLACGVVAPLAPADQVPASAAMALRVVALTRLVCQYVHLPATTALATVDPAEGRVHALQAGANVLMPNLTPLAYRRLYDIYPAKAGSADDDPLAHHGALLAAITAAGRTIGVGPGASPNWVRRTVPAAPPHRD